MIKYFGFLICFSFLIAVNNLVSGQQNEKVKIKFIDNFFENASPLSWKIQGDTIVKIFLFPDYEYETLNRQTDHWYFKLVAGKGDQVKFILSKLMPNIRGGRVSTNWWNFDKDISCYISYDRKTWEAIKTSKLPGLELLVEFTMREKEVYIARMPPYTISDLEKLKTRISKNKLVKIHTIGTTTEKRPIEVIQLGNAKAPNSILIRARAHPWETGGNWLAEGLINKFISQNSKKWQETFCVYIMPMANKDGVAHGLSRYNVLGIDLNRKCDEKPDSILCPENFALDKFIARLIKFGKKPCLGIDIHNDDFGGIDWAQHRGNDPQFLKNIQLFEKLMREHTSFSGPFNVGQTAGHKGFQNGLVARYGIEGFLVELNANWMSTLNKMPSQKDWMEIGENLNNVFYEYLTGQNK